MRQGNGGMITRRAEVMLQRKTPRNSEAKKKVREGERNVRKSGLTSKQISDLVKNAAPAKEPQRPPCVQCMARDPTCFSASELFRPRAPAASRRKLETNVRPALARKELTQTNTTSPTLTSLGRQQNCKFPSNAHDSSSDQLSIDSV